MSSQYELGLGVGILIGWITGIVVHFIFEYYLERFGFIPRSKEK